MILAGDIGGTNTRLALVEPLVEPVRDGRFRILRQERFAGREYPHLPAIIEVFLGQAAATSPPRHGCFGIAGAVVDGRCTTTNLPWVVDAAELAERFSLENAWLLNDLEANAWGIEALAPADLHELHGGAREGSARPRGNRAVISAGTGLGEAGIYDDGRGWRPFACEGGHSSFAPQNELEYALHAFLAKKLPHVSWERVLSGQGLANIYAFLISQPQARVREIPREHVVLGDLPATISRAALAGADAHCVRALEMFVGFYGAEAGNLALKMMATGGVYLGGGIAPKILPKLVDGPFLAAFFAKGRLEPLLRTIPVSVILNPDTALLGAALVALRKSGSSA